MSNNNNNNQHDIQKGIVAWFCNNHVAANILMMLFILGGIVAIKNMQTETFPSIDPKLVSVSVAYPGASPYEIADAITNRVERSLIGIEGVKRISSTAYEGMGAINVELKDFVDADDVYNDVKTSVDGLIDFPPEDAERPIIKKVRLTPNVLTIAIHGDASEFTLKHWAEFLEDEIRNLNGVSLTDLRGVRRYQISIEIPEKSLRHYNLNLQDIGTVISQFSNDIPAGTIEANQGNILLRIQEKRYSSAEFEKIAIKTLENGSKLYLGDIGKVIDGFDDVNLLSKFNGENAVFLDVLRSTSDDTLKIASSVKNYLENVPLPKGITLTLQEDETFKLRGRINLMLRNGIIGFMLVFLILLLFLDLKLAFWTSAAIPISFLGGIMIMNLMGFSLNMVSLFGLIVVLGIVVDDGIITGESIFDAQERLKNNPNATLLGAKSVLAPVLIGVATTMAAFAPLIFSTGTLGQIIKVIPVFVISILFVSLIDAYFILPAHLADGKRWSCGIVADIRDKFSAGLASFIEKKLLPWTRFILKWRYATIAAFVSIAIITANLMSSGFVRFLFFPPVEGESITINATMSQGTPFAVTKKTMLLIEEKVDDVRQELIKEHKSDHFENISLVIGEITGSAFGEGADSSGGDRVGQIKINLAASNMRKVSSFAMESMVRKRIENFPAIETLDLKSSPIGSEADIKIELAHQNEASLIAAAEELKQLLAEISGTKEVADSFELGKEEYVFKLNNDGHAVGLTPVELGRQIRNAFFGFEVQRIQRGRSEVIVYVRYPKEERESLESLKEARIQLADGSRVPLSSIATVEKQFGYSQIETVNGRRIVSVTSDVDSAITTPTDVMSVLRSSIIPGLLEKYSGLSYSFEGESREQEEDMASLGKNMLIAMMIIYVLLGAQLRSYVQPFIIMAAIPFGVVGAILGHFLLGYDLTFISMFGIVALSGVVVNDSVVLMDYFNKRMEVTDETVYEALLMSVKRRFRPILLTTLSTSIGLLPILMETSFQAQFLIPMAIALATGIIFATTVILMLIPCLILVTDDIKSLFRR